MRPTARWFVLGLVAGAVLTFIGIRAGSDYWRAHLVALGQPDLRSLGRNAHQADIPYPPSSDKLPAPRVPTGPQLGDPSAYASWQLTGLNGTTTTLKDLEGKVVFLNFWATWCAPCIAEMPGIQNLADSLAGQPVVFLIVTEEDEAAVRRFLAKTPFRVPVYTFKSKPPATLRAGGVPATFVLDKRGAVVLRDIGGANWASEDARQFLLSLR